MPSLALCDGPPVVSDPTVMSVGRMGVAVAAQVESGGLETTWHVEYGLTTAYGSSTASEPVAAGETGQAYVFLNGLLPGRRHHWRVVARNAAGTVSSADGSFVTPAFPGNSDGSFVLVDADGDGDLDLVQPGMVEQLPEGSPETEGRLQLNDGTGHFSPASAVVPALARSGRSMAVTDFDRDGDADILLVAGGTFGQSTFTLLTGEAGTFVETSAGLPDLEGAFAAWGDYDNDGDDDLLVAGWTGGAVDEFTTQLWRNDGGSLAPVLTEGSPLVGMRDGVARWADTDGDGDVDLVMTGLARVLPDDFPKPLSVHYRNDGAGRFTEVQREFFTVDVKSMAFADWDADGDPDVAGGGEPLGSATVSTAYKGGILRNQGGVFALPAFRGVVSEEGEDWASVGWTDSDNDGWLDLAVVAGRPGFGDDGLRYVNRWAGGPGGFGTPVAMRELPGPGRQLGWGDLTGDASADLVLSQTNAGISSVTVWSNEPAAANAPPAAPSGIAASPGNGRIDFQWAAATDDHTPAAALTYNLRVGTAPGLGDILPPLSRLDGRRLVADGGNVGHGTTAWLRVRPGTSLRFAVQAIDGAGAASGFSGEGTLTVPFTKPGVEWGTPSVASTGATLRGTVFPNGQPTTWYFEYGTTPSYGQRTPTLNAGDGIDPVAVLRVASSLVPETTYHFRLVATNATGTSVTADVALETPSLALFSVLSGANDFSDTLLRKAEWVDVDRDGRPDLVALGRDTMGDASYVYHNDPVPDPIGGEGMFQRSRTQSGSFSALGLGDVNRDGSADIVLIGLEDFFMARPTTMLFSHLSGMSFGFEESWRNGRRPQGVWRGAVALPDVLNNGERALFLAGDTAGGGDGGGPGLPEPATRLYRLKSDDAGVPALGLERLQGVGFPSLSNGGCAWGDYDGDGDNDVLLFGSPAAEGNATAAAVTQLWRNDGGGVFAAVGAPFPGLAEGEAVWVDFDVDGQLDVSLCGHRETGQPYTALWRNAGGAFVQVVADFVPVGRGSMSWADFDADGDPDLALSGDAAAADSSVIRPVTRLYRNDRTGFRVTAPGFPDVVGVVRWGDADADGRPDLLVAGDASPSASGEVAVGAVWRNDMPGVNVAPSPPGNLRAGVESGRMVFRWNAAFDPETPADGLTYAIRLGTSSGSNDLVSAEAGQNQWIGMDPPDPLSGRRLLTGPGNVGLGTSAWLAADAMVPGQTLYWTVQAVDAAGVGSRFATEKSLIVPALPPIVEGLPPAGHAAGSVIFRGSVDPRGAATSARFDYGLTASYGNSTALSVVAANAGVAGQSVSHAASGLPVGVPIHYRLVATNSAGQASTADGILVLPGQSNDLLANRQRLSGASAQAGARLATATTEEGESPAGAGHTVWWQWTAPQDGPVRFACAGSTVPTVLTVYLRERLPDAPPAPPAWDELLPVGSASWSFNPINGAATDPEVQLPAVGGETYFIQADLLPDGSSSFGIEPAVALSIDLLTLRPELTADGRFALTLSGPPGASVELLRASDLPIFPSPDGTEAFRLDSTGKCRLLDDAPRAAGREFIRARLSGLFP